MAEKKESRASVLLIDDEEDFLFTMKTWLESRGFSVETASSGRAGIEKLKQRRPDIVFVDMKMPVMDGVETLAAIRGFDEKIPVIVITAFGLNTRLQDAERYGVTGFFRKSQDLNQAAELIEQVINKVKETKN